jgi:signal transduction histidine kinase
LSYYIKDEAQMPFIIEQHGNIIEANDAFLSLSGFSNEDLFGKPLSSAWNDLFRINVDFDSINLKTEAFLFTKSLIIRYVKIEKQTTDDFNSTIYTFFETPNSRFEVQIPYVDYLYHRGNSGVAVYSIPDLILIKANQRYLNFLDEHYNKRCNSIGRTIETIVTGFKGSKFEKEFYRVLNTGEVFDMQEEPFNGFERGITYWDTTVVPIYEDGCMKYLTQISHEVTEAVINKGLLEAQNKIIKQQKEQLEAIIENMSECLYIYDKHGKCILKNKASDNYARKVISAADNYKPSMYFDVDGNEVPLAMMPSIRVLRGEKFTNNIVCIKEPNFTEYLNISGVPIFDECGSVDLGVICMHKITDLVYSQNKLKEQHEELIRIEKEKNEVLENAMKIKDEFLYLITHEFRTPMAVMNSALQAIELMYKGEVTPNVRKYLDIVKQNTNRQLRLVNNLLDITRMSSGHIKLNKSYFDIVYVTNAIVNSIALFAKQKGVNINFTPSILKDIVYLDEEKFERIMLNLLSNALKFTPHGKNINVVLSVEKSNDQNSICVSVIDEGIGIPKDKQILIFERFGQVDNSLSRPTEGTGLGLHLVKLLVHALEGEIKLVSEEGKGSTFTIQLPTTKPISLDEITECSETNKLLFNSDSRIVQVASIEFSDIYF